MADHLWLSATFLTAALALPGCTSTDHSLVAAAVAPGAKVCDARQYGAVGDGTTLDTAAIQAAVDACTGGTVLLQDGRFRSGMIRLGSNLTLSIAASATLLGSQDPADYPDTTPPTANSQLLNCRKALVYAESVHNLKITGGGTIDGNGAKPAWTAPGVKEATRPMAVYIALSDTVTIEDIAVNNAAMWTLVTLETDNLVIRDVTIHSPNGPTRDGIDLVDCHHVLVEGVSVYSEDDGICLKSGLARGVEDVMVRNSSVEQSSVAQGLKLGTASTGHFTGITFENIAIGTVDKAAMAVESVDGAAISDVTFAHVTFNDAGAAVFVLLGKRGSAREAGGIGTIDRVTFRDIQGKQTKHAWGSPVSGTLVGGVRFAPTNLVFERVHVTSAGGLANVPAAPPEYAGQYPDPNLWGNLPASGLFLRHADVALTDTTFATAAPDARQTTVEIDVVALTP